MFPLINDSKHFVIRGIYMFSRKLKNCIYITFSVNVCLYLLLLFYSKRAKKKSTMNDKRHSLKIKQHISNQHILALHNIIIGHEFKI